MLDYIEGDIVKINFNSIILNNNGIGFNIYMSNPYVFKEGENVKIYLYNYIREEEYSLYGFKSEEERDMFLKLISVKGVGPKLALPILATSSVSGIMDAIDRENILYLKKFPKIGEKLARQIILDLKGKLVKKEDEIIINNELVSVLQNLGYKNNDIKRVISEVNVDLPLESQVKEALKLMVKR